MRRLRRGAAAFAALLGLLVGPALAGPADLPPGLARAVAVQEANQAGLLARPGVVGVGIGTNPAGEPVIQVLATSGDTARGLPRRLAELPVEVRITGQLRAHQALTPAARWPRPVPIGVSAGHPDVTAGTLGALVYRGKRTRTYFVLSNNHVIANGNLALAGDPVLQPGAFDGGTAPADVIATLAEVEPIVFSDTASNTMDAAIAQVVGSSVDFRTPLDGYGAPATGSVSPALNLRVMKYGRTTGLTSGTITGINYTVLVTFGAQTARFVGQLIVTGDGGDFSRPGDSGALVVAAGGRNARKPVGLHFAGGDGVSVESPIRPILSRFAVAIAGQ